jgi:hypothetical protein
MAHLFTTVQTTGHSWRSHILTHRPGGHACATWLSWGPECADSVDGHRCDPPRFRHAKTAGAMTLSTTNAVSTQAALQRQLPPHLQKGRARCGDEGGGSPANYMYRGAVGMSCCQLRCQTPKTRESSPEHHRSKPLHFWICVGRWDRNRTCNLRFWRPNQRAIESVRRPNSSRFIVRAGS